MLKYIRLSIPYCVGCLDIIRKDQESRQKQERVELVNRQKAKWIAQSGVPVKFMPSSFGDFDSGKYPHVFKMAKLFADGFQYSDTRGMKSLYLYSTLLSLGVGKSYLSACIVNAIINNWDGAGWDAEYDIQSPVLFVSEREFLLEIRASFNHRYDPKYKTEDEIYKRLIGIPLLVLDDVGKEETDKRDSGDNTSSSFVRRAYWQVIDGRYQANLPMVITANYSIDNMKRYLGEPSVDRITEMCGDSKNIIELRGKSKRVLRASE